MAKKQKKKSTFWEDFKKFITKGNVIDMAVAVVIGGAFGKITTGLVNHIITPLTSIFLGEIDTFVCHRFSSPASKVKAAAICFSSTYTALMIRMHRTLTIVC